MSRVSCSLSLPLLLDHVCTRERTNISICTTHCITFPLVFNWPRPPLLNATVPSLSLLQRLHLQPALILTTESISSTPPHFPSPLFFLRANRTPMQSEFISAHLELFSRWITFPDHHICTRVEKPFLLLNSEAYCLFHISWRDALITKKNSGPTKTLYLDEFLLKNHWIRKSYETEVIGTLQQMSEVEKGDVWTSHANEQAYRTQ